MKSKVEESCISQECHTYLENKPGTPVIVVNNFPTLGKLTAYRFIEWVQQNPGGVVSLPTGKTPEHFIKEVIRLKNSWTAPAIVRELEQAGIDPAKQPAFSDLKFVQIDEFYPINPRHSNSFHYYVKKYYLEGFGIPEENSLLINCEEIGLENGMTLEEAWRDDAVDITLRNRTPATDKEIFRKGLIQRIDQWCVEYEDRIRKLGGIGFFLGGIGPDGHIGFNIRGSDLYSTTRLMEVNYETLAAAATDLGGIQTARKRLVITIGLSTITYNPECTAIIMAAGETKSKILADAVQNDRNVLHPATVLRELKNARYYITTGAAKSIKSYQIINMEKREDFYREDFERLAVDISLHTGKKILDLSEADFKRHWLGGVLVNKVSLSIQEIKRLAVESLKDKIDAGIQVRMGKQFLHTEPHHDDIMLGYLPFVVRNIREHSNQHYFATLTSGFTSVTNDYMLTVCRRMKRALQKDKYQFSERLESGYFSDEKPYYRDHDVYTYLDGIAARNLKIQEKGTLMRLLRDLISIYDDTDLNNLTDRVDELINYFETQYPGKKDLPYIQKLKGTCREWESACLWGYFGWNSAAVDHLRLGFYTGDIFTEEPTLDRDAAPVLGLLRNVRPDLVTVAFDPEASGPDTHYKVMQAIAEAVRMYSEETDIHDLEIIGYRNVWYRFHPAEVNIFVPVSLNMMTLQHESFMNTYISQRDASFPSYEFDGPFSLLAQKIQVQQYDNLTTCLGRKYFYEHESALIRATRGFVFLKSMNIDEFQGYTRTLRKQTENR